MGAIKEDIQYIEVISKFTVDGTVIPIKLKVQDEDGEYQSFMIKGYRTIICNPSHKCYDCKIEVFNQERIVRIFYNGPEFKWRILRKDEKLIKQ